MKLKNIWLIFGILFLVLVPIKIYSAVASIAFIESYNFFVIFGLAVIALALASFFSKFSIKNISIKPNAFLGIVALIISGCFFWCVPAHFNDTVTKYDAEWHPIILTVFAGLSCVSFLLLAITHFKGKNIIAKVPFFLYCPVLWFGTKMILFLSMNINETNPYVVFSTGLFTFFMLYFTQTFATSTKCNNVKILFVFGLPLLLLSSCATIPVLLKSSSNSLAISSVATASLELALSIYVLFTLLVAYKQSVYTEKVIKEF